MRATSRTGPHRSAALAAAVALAGLAAGQVVLPAQAAGDAPDGTSAAVVDWEPRHPDDGPEAADRAPFDALSDWSLKVSQTRDLLNQTVQVSWTGADASGDATYVQLMQCWSAAPDVAPTREQCAFGGASDADISTTGSSRTRAISGDRREAVYFNSGELVPVTVDGAVPPPTWGDGSSLVLGTTGQACPDGTSGYTVSMVPPRAAVRAGTAPVSVSLEGPTSTPPASLTRDEAGSSRTYPVVTATLDLPAAAAAAGVTAWPQGRYRVQLACADGTGAERARFVGYLDRLEVDGAPVWQRGSGAGGVQVPYDPVGETADDAPTDPYVREEVLDYLQPRTTNEVPLARNRPDGSGSVVMEVLTDLEAQHLACGRVEDGRVRPCWLVAVPRWGPQPGSETVPASPLSQTLWDRRIVVPLSFTPVESGCRIGSGLKQVLSNDSTLLAARSWQPALCRQASTASSVVGPLPDDGIRAGIDQTNRLGIVTVPDAARPRTVVTAPVATSGVVVGFVVDRQVRFGAESYGDLHETRAERLDLNARLVAKLLTQSYDDGAYPNGGKDVPTGGRTFDFSPDRKFPKGNPRTLYDDPEFRRLNADFVTWLDTKPPLPPRKMADVLLGGSSSDAYQVLWRWLLGDPEARAFLDGAADPDGMKVNPYYQGVVTDQTSRFQLLDPTCLDLYAEKEADSFPLLCQSNEHPRVKDDTAAAQAAVRGDTRRFNQAPTLLGVPGEVLGYLPEARQQQGQLGLLVVTTSAIAERYGLPTARLRNADGAFVGATAASMAGARDQMAARASDGVLVPDPARVRGGGYPLTTNAYAMVDVAATTREQNTAFASVLDYAVGPGQQVGRAAGQLPPGYAPLSAELVASARAASALLRDPSSLLPAPVADAPPGRPAGAGPASGPPAATGAGASPGRGSAASGTSAGTVAGALPAAAPGAAAGAAPDAAPLVAGPLLKTIGAPSPARWVVPALLAFGLVAGLAGRLLPLLRRSAPS